MADKQKAKPPKFIEINGVSDQSPEHAIDARELRNHFGMTRNVFARVVDVSERSLADYESKKREPSNAINRRLREVDRLRLALMDIMKPEDIAIWLQTPNQAFDTLKPIEVIERGESDRIWRMLYYIESGTAF